MIRPENSGHSKASKHTQVQEQAMYYDQTWKLGTQQGFETYTSSRAGNALRSGLETRDTARLRNIHKFKSRQCTMIRPRNSGHSKASKHTQVIFKYVNGNHSFSQAVRKKASVHQRLLYYERTALRSTKLKFHKGPLFIWEVDMINIQSTYPFLCAIALGFCKRITPKGFLEGFYCKGSPSHSQCCTAGR